VPRHLLVGNPSAQSGKARAAIETATAMLRERGVDVVAIDTEPGGRTPGLVAHAIGEHEPDAVLCLGGDGTFNEVARGILASERTIPMGMMPMGTANDQGRSFGLEPGAGHLARHVDVILSGHRTQLDVGVIQAISSGAVEREGLFFDGASFGLAPDILAVRNRDRGEIAKIPVLGQLYRDRAVYVGAAIDRILASFVEPTKFDAVVETESWERTWRGLTDLVIKATPIFAGGWVFDRRAEPDDGLFEAIPVKSRREWIARVIGDLAANPLPPPREHLAAKRFEIHFYRPGGEEIASQIDGEEWARSDRFRIEVRANALSLYTPKGYVAPWRA
jgi:diacylglycerol kinase family enzyme